jgi:hypothetical protein
MIYAFPSTNHYSEVYHPNKSINTDTPRLSWAYIYPLMDSETTHSDDNIFCPGSAGRQSSSSFPEDYWNDGSETSISFDEAIPSHLNTPRRLPITQLVDNWWRFR